MQVAVGQAAYPCYHFYRSKPHDKTQCARVLNGGSSEWDLSCGHASPKVGMALATSPTALWPEPSPIASCGESKVAHGEQKPLVARAPPRRCQGRVCIETTEEGSEHRGTLSGIYSDWRVNCFLSPS